MRQLEGRTAIVIAAGSGIGAATAKLFAAEGARVVVADLSGRRGGEIAESIRGSGGEAISIKMDVAEPSGIEATIRLALDTYGRLDILHNNAGYATIADVHETSLEEWNRAIAVNLTGTFLAMRLAIPVMRKQGKGAIVNTASVSGLAGDYGMGAYNAAKAGLINLTRTVAIENAKYGIRANCVCPGMINTRVAEVLSKGREEEFRALGAAAHPIGRIGEPDEVAAAALFLASDLASFVTGQAIAIDGGLTAQSGMPPLPRPGK